MLNHFIEKHWRSILIVLAVPALLFGLTKTTGMWIVNSQIDSTLIGANVPSTARFTQTHVVGGNYNFGTQGSYGAWNLSGQTGETDFIDNKGTGVGGWIWFLSNGSSLSQVAYLSAQGTLYATDFSGSFNGPLYGNSTTTTSFAAPPANCNSGYVSNGINADGSANCIPNKTTAFISQPTQCAGNWLSNGINADGSANCRNIPFTAIASTYFQSCAMQNYSDSDQNCVSTQSWGTTINGTYTVQCTSRLSFSGGNDSSGLTKTTIGVTNLSSSGFSYYIANDHGAAAGGSIPINCVAFQ